MAPDPVTTCHVCDTTRNESLTDHLAEHHMNQMFHIETDPASGVSVIHTPAPPLTYGSTYGA